MREKDFLKLYMELYKGKGGKIASERIARHKVDSIWEALIETLLKEKKIIFKGTGKFELREANPRKVVLPLKKEGEDNYIFEKKIIPSKKKIKFIPGENFKKLLNKEECENNE